MSESILHALHEAAGAVFTEVGGWQTPAHYGDFDAEYRAVREAAGVVDRSGRGKLRVTGSDRVRFLHGMLSNTVQGLPEGAGNYATLTTPQGQTLADVWVHNRGEAFLLETEPGLQQKLHASLDRYLIADDVEIQDVTENWAILGVHGPGSPALVSGVAAGEVPEDLAEGHAAVRSAAGAEVTVVPRSYTGAPGFDLWVAAAGAPGLWAALLAAGGRPVGFQAMEALRIEAGIPRYGADVDERVMPLEGGLAHAVDFKKGCFIGQEALAKMQNLGKPRRSLVGLHVTAEAPPEPGTPVLADGKEVGWVTSSLRSPALGRTVALASVRRGYEAPGQALALEGGAAAEVVALPFYRKDGG